MTYTYNDQAIFEAVPGAKAIIRRPIGMPDKKWAKYADGVVKALDNRAPCTPLERGESLHKAASLMMVEAVNACLAESAPPMKLVDILARELKAWPDCIVVGQSTSGQLHKNSAPNSGSCFGHTSEVYSKAVDWKTAYVTRAEWQAAVDALNAPKVDIADGNVRLGVLIEMGYLKPVRFETPSYDFSAWPPERFDCGLLPSLYVQSFGRSKRHQPVEPKPKSTAQENTEFLQARVKLLEAQNIELVKQSWLPNKDAAASRDRIKDLESQLEQLSADNEILSDIVVQLDDNAIQVLMRARDGDGLYFTSKEGQKVSVLRSGS